MTHTLHQSNQRATAPRHIRKFVVILLAIAMAGASNVFGGGRPAYAANTTIYPEHTYYANCTGTLLDTGFKGPFVSVVPTSLKPWPGIGEYVIDPSGAFHPFYTGEYVYYRAFVQWYQAGAWHIRYAGQRNVDQGNYSASSLGNGDFQFRASAGFPSGGLQKWVGVDTQGHGLWENYGGSGFVFTLYPQAEFGESWVPLGGPVGTRNWLGVQTVWGQVLGSNTGYGMPGLPAVHSEYLSC